MIKLETLAEKEHRIRAKSLRECFGTAEGLAEFLHQNYRATAKSLSTMHHIAIGPVAHDHGFGDCYGKKKAYFIRRAKWLMAGRPKFNGAL